MLSVSAMDRALGVDDEQFLLNTPSTGGRKVARCMRHPEGSRLTEAVVPDIRSRLNQVPMRTRTATIPCVILAVAVSLCAGPLDAQPVQASENHEPANEVY